MVRLISDKKNLPDEEILQITDKFDAEVLLDQELCESFLQGMFVESRIRPSSKDNRQENGLELRKSAPIPILHKQPTAVTPGKELLHTYILAHV